MSAQYVAFLHINIFMLHIDIFMLHIGIFYKKAKKLSHKRQKYVAITIKTCDNILVCNASI